MRAKYKYIPGCWQKIDGEARYVPFNYNETSEVCDVSGEPEDILLKYIRLAMGYEPKTELVPLEDLEEGKIIDRYGHVVLSPTARQPIMYYHLQLFSEGCRLNRGRTSKEDKAMGKRIKKYLEEIDQLRG